MNSFTKLKSYLLVIFGYILISLPTLVHADPAPVRKIAVELENPLKNVSSIDGLLVAILNIVMILMVPVIVFFIILAGFKYVTARGNATKVEEATRALTYAIIGGVLVLGAVAISEIIKQTVNQF